MRNRLPVVLSATALVIALFGSTPAGHAVTSVLFAQNAHKVDGFHASDKPRPNKLVALNDASNLWRKALPPGTLWGARVVRAFSGSSAAKTHHVEATCDPGHEVAVGGGYEAEGALPPGTAPIVWRSAPVYESGVSRLPTGWAAHAQESPESTDPEDDWGVWAYAVCVAYTP
jgi:hypothetical protein